MSKYIQLNYNRHFLFKFNYNFQFRIQENKTYSLIDDFTPYFEEFEYEFNNILKESKHHKSISTILPEYMPLSFKNHIEEMNIVFGATQIEWITKIIQAIETKQNKVLTSNIKKCLYWCKKYNQGYNNIEN